MANRFPLFDRDRKSSKNKSAKKSKKDKKTNYDKNRKGLEYDDTPTLDGETNFDENHDMFNDKSNSSYVHRNALSYTSAFQEYNYRHSRNSSDELSSESDLLPPVCSESLKSTSTSKIPSHWKSMSSLPTSPIIKKGKLFSGKNQLQSVSENCDTNLSACASVNDLDNIDTLCDNFCKLNLSAEYKQEVRTYSEKHNNGESLTVALEENGKKQSKTKTIDILKNIGKSSKKSNSENKTLGILKSLGKQKVKSDVPRGDPVCSFSESGNIVTTPASQRKFIQLQETSHGVKEEEILEENGPVVYAMPSTSRHEASTSHFSWQNNQNPPCNPSLLSTRSGSVSLTELSENVRKEPAVVRSTSLSNLSNLPGLLKSVLSRTKTSPAIHFNLFLPPDSGTASLENILENSIEIEEGATAIGGHHDRPDPAHPDEILDIRSQLREMTLPDGLIETTDAFYKKHHKKSYPMMHKHRGRAFVATYTAGREGWQNDQLSLQQLFLFLKIEAEYWFDESKKELLDHLAAFANSRENSSVDCVFVVLMGHGGTLEMREFLESADGKPVYIREYLEHIFSNELCPNLKGKPKMILLQMCRDTGNLFSHIRLSATPDPGDKIWLDQRKEFTDYILAYATQPGKQAMRNHSRGSWFIQDFVEVFLKRSHDESVLEMLTQVMSLCADRGQVSEPALNLNKSFYLFPGIWTHKIMRKFKAAFR